MNKMKSKNIKKGLTLLVLFSLIPCRINAQEQSNKQECSVLSQYQHEKLTVPYKTTHKVAKGRRVATRKGNKELKKEHYSKAVNDYRNAMKADSNYAKAQFNRALAHSKLHQNDTSITYYDKVCRNSSATAEQRAKAHYNAGNIHLRKALATRDTGGYDAQSLHKAIDEYKAALRLNCKNTDAQYNLSLAKQLLRPEQQGGGGGGGQNQQEQNQQKNNQQQQQNQDQHNQQQNQQKQQQSGNQNKQDNKQQEQRRREAEQMLNAMKNNEQQTMKAVRMKEANKERQQENPNRIEKDW